MTNRIMNDEWREKISASTTGKKKTLSDEQREAKRQLISRVHTGKHVSEDTREKMSKARTGMRDTDHTKLEKSKARKAFMEFCKEVQAEHGLTYSEACAYIKQHKLKKPEDTCKIAEDH